MRSLAGEKGFTLAEVLIATSLASILGGVTFALIQSGMLVEQNVRHSTSAVAASARLARSIRGEVARADSLVHVASDSLAVLRTDGTYVAFAARSEGQHVAIYRWLDTGGGWALQPMRAFARLAGTSDEAAALTFSGSGDWVTCNVTAAGFDGEFGAGPWLED